MDYKDKYIKYKIKYLQLKNKNNMICGNYIPDYTIIKTLGKGMHGTVYLVKNNSGE
jgi:serine/threonine protein kinase